jgi:hypothetical protein
MPIDGKARWPERARLRARASQGAKALKSRRLASLVLLGATAFGFWISSSRCAVAMMKLMWAAHPVPKPHLTALASSNT